MITTIEEIGDLLTPEQVKSICKSGNNQAAVFAVEKQTNLKISRSTLKKMVKPYGIYEHNELSKWSLIELKQRVIWLAAWNVFDRAQL